MFTPAYFDHNATTPLLPQALEAMLPFLGTGAGNASSRHEYGRAARRALDEARQRVAWAVGAHPTEVVFTGGGSEANNLVIKGLAWGRAPGRMAISAIEHPCVREPARQLSKLGWQIDEVAVRADGRIDEAAHALAMAQSPVLVSLMYVNNETGVIQDVVALAARCKTAAGTWFHSDAVQALGKCVLDFRTLNRAGVHALTLSAHKVGGPQGVGALVLDKRMELAPLIAGGGQERGLRSGTENVAGIVGFGIAAERAASTLDQRNARKAAQRATLETALIAMDATIYGAQAPRVANTTYFSLPGIDGETLVAKLDRAGFAVASGAACSSAHPEPSRTLTAMGVSPESARGAVRVSLGEAHTDEEIARLIAAIQATRAELCSLRAVANSVN